MLRSARQRLRLPILQDADGLILSGGPASVYDPEAPAYNPDILVMGKPMLGLCYGHQLLCHRLGGQVEMGTTHEFGAGPICTSTRQRACWPDWTRASGCG